MTSLAELDAHVTKGGEDDEKLPSFTFKRVTRQVKGKQVRGDGVKGRVLRSEMVDVTRDNVTKKKLVMEVELVEESRGGIVEKVNDDDGNEVTKYANFPAGTKVTVWVGNSPGFEAVRDAVAGAGGAAIEDGAIIEYWLDAHKETGKTYPLNLFGAIYTPPVRATSIDEFE